MQKLAEISDDLSNVFPIGKSVVVFSVNETDFNNTKLQVDNFGNMNQFKIDISGIEFIFLKDELLNVSEGN
jgi:hypothetical protein